MPDPKEVLANPTQVPPDADEYVDDAPDEPPQPTVPQSDEPGPKNAPVPF